MKYAIVKCINGNFSIHAEGFTSLDKALDDIMKKEEAQHDAK